MNGRQRLDDLDARIKACIQYHGFTDEDMKRARRRNQVEKFRVAITKIGRGFEELGKAIAKAAEQGRAAVQQMRKARAHDHL